MIEELRDVKAPVDFPVNMWPWIILGIILLIAGVVFLVKYFQKRKSNQITVPALEPWELAYEQLKRLEGEGLLNQGNFIAFFVKLSDIARRYLEARFSIRAPEMTTEEFLISLKQTYHLNERQKESLRDFLTLCDLVKFAKFEPQIQDGTKGFQLVKMLVDETKPVVVVENPSIKT